MKKLLTLALACAVPAHAQDAPSWPVEATGATCAIEQAFSSADFGTTTLRVSYDPARQLVILTATSAAPLALPELDKIDLHIMFLENNGEAQDVAWGARRFTTSQNDGARTLATAFSGKQNVDQIFKDLAASKALGLLHRGEVVTAFDLLGAGQAIGRLRACAARLAQS